jgi:hypothetical protein
MVRINREANRRRQKPKVKERGTGVDRSGKGKTGNEAKKL